MNILKACHKILSAYIVAVLAFSPAVGWGVSATPYIIIDDGVNPSVMSTQGGYAGITHLSPSIPENTTFVANIEAATSLLADAVGEVYLSSADQEFFEIVGDEIHFKVAPDFEDPQDNPATYETELNNIYRVGFRLDDGSTTAGININVEVTNVSDFDPEIETNGLSDDPLVIEIPEDQYYTSTSTVSDADGGDVWFVGITGDDADLFGFDTDTGVLAPVQDTFDYENPDDENGDNVYEVVLNAEDELGGTGSQTLHIMVTDVENEPVFDASSITATSTDEEQIELLGTISVYDPQNAETSLSLESTGDSGLFEIQNHTTSTTTVGTTTVLLYHWDLYFSAAPDFEVPGDNDTDNVYEVVAVAENSLGQTTKNTVEVTVNPVNEHAPVFTQLGGEDTGGVTMLDDRKRVVTLTATDADLPGDDLEFSIDASSTDAALFNINTNNDRLRFNDFPTVGTYEVTVVVSDGVVTDTQDITVYVLDSNVNYPPVIVNYDSTTTVEVTVEEGYTGLVENVDRTDLNGDDKVWTIEGDDVSFFSINSNNGKLNLTGTTDFENPLDANGDNVYEVTVVVTDIPSVGDPASTTQTYLVEVTDVEEAPFSDRDTVFMLEEMTFPQFAWVIWSDLQNDLDTIENGTSTDFVDHFESDFETDGDDVWQWIANTAVFNYESPTDENTDNVYQWDVVASDTEDNISTTTVMVEILNINEFAPTITTASGSASTTVTITEGSTAVITLEGEDLDGVEEMEWVINASSTDAGFFTISSTTGELVFANAPVFANPEDENTDNTYEVEVWLLDNGQDRCETLYDYLEDWWVEYADYFEVDEDEAFPFFEEYDEEFVEFCAYAFDEEELFFASIDFNQDQVEEEQESITVFVTVEEQPEEEEESSGGGGGSVVRYACRDQEASNYSPTGRSDPDRCEYDEEEDQDEDEDENDEGNNGGSDGTGGNTGGNTTRSNGNTGNNNSGTGEFTGLDLDQDDETGTTTPEEQDEESAATSTAPTQTASILNALTGDGECGVINSPWVWYVALVAIMAVVAAVRIFGRPDSWLYLAANHPGHTAIIAMSFVAIWYVLDNCMTQWGIPIAIAGSWLVGLFTRDVSTKE